MSVLLPGKGYVNVLEKKDKVLTLILLIAIVSFFCTKLVIIYDSLKNCKKVEF